MNLSKFLNISANFISIVFHPLIITSIACFIVFNSGHYISIIDSNIKTSIYFIFFVMTFLMPALLIPVLYYFNLISKIQTDSQKDRILSLFVVGVLYALSFYFMSRVVFPEILLKIVLSSVVLVFICMFISILHKLSLHTCGTGGLIALLFYLFSDFGLDIRFYLLISILISGLVGTARLMLRKHNSFQIYLGWIIGFIVVFIVLKLL